MSNSQTCSVCGEEYTEDDRALATWDRVILKRPPFCSKECLDKIKESKGGNHVR